MTKYKCACCGEYTLTESPGYFEECDNCGWVDNSGQNNCIDLRGGANVISLREAREIYKRAIQENLDPAGEIQKANEYAHKHWNLEKEKERFYKLYPERKQKVENSK